MTPSSADQPQMSVAINFINPVLSLFALHEQIASEVFLCNCTFDTRTQFCCPYLYFSRASKPFIMVRYPEMVGYLNVFLQRNSIYVPVCQRCPTPVRRARAVAAGFCGFLSISSRFGEQAAQTLQPARDFIENRKTGRCWGTPPRTGATFIVPAKAFSSPPLRIFFLVFSKTERFSVRRRLSLTGQKR